MHSVDVIRYLNHLACGTIGGRRTGVNPNTRLCFSLLLRCQSARNWLENEIQLRDLDSELTSCGRTSASRDFLEGKTALTLGGDAESMTNVTRTLE